MSNLPNKSKSGTKSIAEISKLLFCFLYPIFERKDLIPGPLKAIAGFFSKFPKILLKLPPRL